MKNGKMIKNIGLILMIAALVFMVYAYIKRDSLEEVMAGLIVVSIGSFVSYYGSKQMQSD
ncbi:MAG: hypothetical protein AAF985_16500 [Bacteroidota bacterium]